MSMILCYFLGVISMFVSAFVDDNIFYLSGTIFFCSGWIIEAIEGRKQ